MLKRWDSQVKDQWASGVFERDTEAETIKATRSALAEANVVKRILGIDYEQFKESFDE